jgi:hypothetical protein
MLKERMATYWRAWHYGLPHVNLVVLKYGTHPVYYLED